MYYKYNFFKTSIIILDASDDENANPEYKEIFSKYEGIMMMICEVCNRGITDASKFLTLEQIGNAVKDYFRRINKK